MGKMMVLLIAVLLAACDGENSDGSSKSTYSSCKITKSQALFSDDRSRDLKQCWTASGKGYSSQGDALAWCAGLVNDYMDDHYLFGHTIEYAVESTYCPKK